MQYARLGEGDKAYELFVQSFRPNQLPPFGVISEGAGGTNPYFVTGAGGLLQTVINGFCGLEVQIMAQAAFLKTAETLEEVDDNRSGTG